MAEQHIIDRLDVEADILRDGNSGASDDELADLLGEASEEITRLCAKVENLCQQTRDAFVDGVFFALEGYPTDETIEDWRNEAKSRWPHPASCQRS